GALDLLRRKLVPELPEIRYLLAAVADRMQSQEEERGRDREALDRELSRLKAVLQSVQAGEWAARQRLRAMREDPSYEAPFTTDAPLVSVVIPTYERVETLTQRALPSVLGQSYGNLDVLIVGDGSPPEVE